MTHADGYTQEKLLRTLNFTREEDEKLLLWIHAGYTVRQMVKSLDNRKLEDVVAHIRTKPSLRIASMTQKDDQEIRIRFKEAEGVCFR